MNGRTSSELWKTREGSRHKCREDEAKKNLDETGGEDEAIYRHLMVLLRLAVCKLSSDTDVSYRLQLEQLLTVLV
jgi:hypothetical protein